MKCTGWKLSWIWRETGMGFSSYWSVRSRPVNERETWDRHGRRIKTAELKSPKPSSEEEDKDDHVNVNLTETLCSMGLAELEEIYVDFELTSDDEDVHMSEPAVHGGNRDQAEPKVDLKDDLAVSFKGIVRES